MTKLLIDLQAGRFEVEGEAEFVANIYDDMKGAILARLHEAPPATASSVESTSETLVKARSGEKAPRRRKSGGPSCASRIRELKEDGYFADVRTPTDIQDKLSEKGATYPSKNIASALHNLVVGGELRRFKNDKIWNYQNP